MKNQVQLITYVDRLSGGNLQALTQLLAGPLQGVFGGVHLLPFFYPIDGSDAGFDPIDHQLVDPRLGQWDDIKSLSGHLDIMADLIVNHISSESPQFEDFSLHGKASRYNGLFLTLDSVFPTGVTEAEILKIYRPRPGLPFTYTVLKNGEKRLLWTTFTSRQIDINVLHAEGKRYLQGILEKFAQNGIRMIRLDAAGYAIKVPGTTCFMIPQTFEFIEDLRQKALQLGIEVLVEIHSYYQKQIEIARKVDRVYDFALPPLILHTLFTQSSAALVQWLKISPRNCVTVLDTHDGIGVIDVGADPENPENKGLLNASEIDFLVEEIHRRSRGESRQATGAAASNLDLYQVNCTYYNALGADDNLYLLARAIQFFSPGVPQVYYTGLLLGQNDMDLLQKSKVGRDINRHYYNHDEVQECLQHPTVHKLLDLIRFRNSHPAFQGTFEVPDQPSESLLLKWNHGVHFALLNADLRNFKFKIEFSDNGATSLF